LGLEVGLGEVDVEANGSVIVMARLAPLIVIQLTRQGQESGNNVTQEARNPPLSVVSERERERERE